MKAYKGFDKNMQCNGFQYEEGKTYEHDGDIEVCKSGFHACTNPLDVLAYYPAYQDSVYREVECEGDIQTHSEDSKLACSKITVGAEIGLMGLVKLGVKALFERVKKEKPEQYTLGDQSTAATSGYRSTAATSGYRSTAATSGEQSTAATSGYQSTAATSGYQSTAVVFGEESIAVANGYGAKAKGPLNRYIAVTEYDENFHLIDFQAIKVDGERIKPDTYYVLKNGEFVEWEED